MYRLLTVLLLLACAGTARAQSSPAEDSGTKPFTNPFSFFLRMPEKKPHKLEPNDLSELQETRYTQKDEQPISPSLEVPGFSEDTAKPTPLSPATDTPLNRPAF